MSLMERRFWAKVDMKDPTECWPWRAGRDGSGYGIFRVGSKATGAHRLAFEFFHGRKPKKHVLHKCDNPACVNPHHLYEGDDIDNARDLYIGGGGPKRKLSNEQVREIRRLSKTGQYLHRELAERFGCSRQNIGLILSNQRFVYVN